MASSVPLPPLSSPRFGGIAALAQSGSELFGSQSTASFLATPTIASALRQNQAATAEAKLQQQLAASGGFQQPHPFCYGDVLGGSLHFFLESIVARVRCDRVALFLAHPKHNVLMRVTIVGPTAPPVPAQNAASVITGKGDTPGAAGPVTAAVLSTCVAANLSTLAAEDALDCPGSTVAKNALVVPIRPLHPHVTSSAGGDESASSSSHLDSTTAKARGSNNLSHLPMSTAIGVIFAVNKLGGAQVFSNEDQLVMVSLAPSIAYLSETYPLDFSAHRFDPAPLRKVVQLEMYSSKTGSATSSSSTLHHSSNNNNNSHNQANKKKLLGQTHLAPRKRKGNSAGEDDDEAAMRSALKALPDKPPQLVYEQHKEDSLLPYVSKALQQQQAKEQQQPHGSATAAAATAGNVASYLASGQRENLKAQAEALSTAEQILSVGDFVTRMEACWRDAVSRCIATERELTLRNAQVTDAHAILHRKQRRLDVLKDVLVETLEKKVQQPSALVVREY